MGRIPALTVIGGSLITVWPFIGNFPILPPFGLMMLLAWRLRRPDVFRIWAPLPLGAFDDLVSGQPFGSAVLLWTLCFFMIDLFDQRLGFRDYWQDWGIAAVMIGFCLILGRLVASPIAAQVDTLLLLQVLVATMIFPVIARLCAWIDRRREPA